MNIALNEFHDRVKPTPQGRGICQICENVLIAKCGEIYTWHWQHKKDRDCDPWKEYETEWHRRWKNYFPFDWQEVLIENISTERHLADVRTDNGVVLEFQNSPISTSTIRTRETFYGNMIWVINAELFKENFKIRSVVTSHLRSLERSMFNPKVPVEEYYNKEIELTIDEIEDKGAEIEEYKGIIANSHQELEVLKKYSEKVDLLFNKIVQTWIDRFSFYDNIVNKTAKYLEEPYGQYIKSIPEKTKKLNDELKYTRSIKNKMESLPNVELLDSQMKLINYKNLTKDNFHRARIVRKESMETLFPRVERIKGEFEFQSLSHTKDKFDILVDLSEDIINLDNRISGIEAELNQLESYVSTIKPKVRAQLKEALDEWILNAQESITSLQEKIVDLTKQQKQKLDIKTMLEAKKSEEVSLAKKKLALEIKQKRLEIMSESKGLYSFEWKHERTTWRVAAKPLFFDIGEDYLFEKIDDNLFRKMKLDEFFIKFRGTK